MRAMIFLYLISTFSFAADDLFKKEASLLAQSLKSNLMKNVSEKVGQKGVEKAVEFCHSNVKNISKTAAKDYLTKYKFGRTSARLRNQNNQEESWMKPYLEKFKSSKTGEASSFIHTLPSGKKVFLEPLYIQPVCLKCHGENVDRSVLKKISSLYPEDQAVGYRLGEFRGFIWIMEK